MKDDIFCLGCENDSPEERSRFDAHCKPTKPVDAGYLAISNLTAFTCATDEAIDDSDHRIRSN